MLKTVNEQRASVGCSPVTTRKKLNVVAGSHASDMVGRDYFSHESPDGENPFERAKRVGTTVNAENIDAGRTDPVAAAVALWSSPGHQANIANCTFTKVGIGHDRGKVDIRNSEGVPLGAGSWVQVFAS